jgi:hypothetical protein
LDQGTKLEMLSGFYVTGVTVTPQEDSYDFLQEVILRTASALPFGGMARAAEAAKVIRWGLRNLKLHRQRMRREDAERHEFFPS